MIPCIVFPVSRVHDISEKTAYTQMKDGINMYVLSTSSPLCDIREPRYRQNNTVYQIMFIVKNRTIDHS